MHPPARARVLVVRRHDGPGPPRLRAGRLRLGRRVRSQGPHPLRLQPDPAPQQQLGRPELHGLVQQDRQRRDRRGQQHPGSATSASPAYDIVQKEFAKDMVSLPLFQRVEAEAWNPNLEGIKTSPTEYATASAKDWKLATAATPSSSASRRNRPPCSRWSSRPPLQRQACSPGRRRSSTPSSTTTTSRRCRIRSARSRAAWPRTTSSTSRPATWSTTPPAKPVKLEKGVKVFDADGNEVEYDGTSPLKMKQLDVDLQVQGLHLERRHQGLGRRLGAGLQDRLRQGVGRDLLRDLRPDPATSSSAPASSTPSPGCPARSTRSTSWLPSASIYPSHQMLADGRKLADVPGEGMGDPARDRREAAELWPVRADRVEEGREHDLRGQPVLPARRRRSRRSSSVSSPTPDQAVAAAAGRRRRLPGEVDPGRRRRGADRRSMPPRKARSRSRLMRQPDLGTHRHEPVHQVTVRASWCCRRLRQLATRHGRGPAALARIREHAPGRARLGRDEPARCST